MFFRIPKSGPWRGILGEGLITPWQGVDLGSAGWPVGGLAGLGGLGGWYGLGGGLVGWAGG